MRTITVEFNWCNIIPVFKNLKISKESAGKIQIKTVGKYRSCLSPGRDGLHKKCFHTGLGVNAVTSQEVAAKEEAVTSRLCARPKGEEEVLKLLADWERCV